MPYNIPHPQINKLFIKYAENIIGEELDKTDDIIDLDDLDSDYSDDISDDMSDNSSDNMGDDIGEHEVYSLVNDARINGANLPLDIINQYNDVNSDEEIEVSDDVLYFNKMSGSKLPGKYRFDKVEEVSDYDYLVSYINKFKINKWRTYFLDSNINFPIVYKQKEYLSVEHFCLVKSIRKSNKFNDMLIEYGDELDGMSVEQIKKLFEKNALLLLPRGELYKKLRHKAISIKMQQYKHFKALLLSTEFSQLMINGRRDKQHELIRETFTL